MKSASLPALRVTQEVRAEVEEALEEGETLASLLRQAVMTEVRNRRLKKEFLECGLAARDLAKQTGEYYSAEEVLG